MCTGTRADTAHTYIRTVCVMYLPKGWYKDTTVLLYCRFDLTDGFYVHDHRFTVTYVPNYILHTVHQMQATADRRPFTVHGPTDTDTKPQILNERRIQNAYMDHFDVAVLFQYAGQSYGEIHLHRVEMLDNCYGSIEIKVSYICRRTFAKALSTPCSS